jgi:hypothetical protein
VPQNRVFGSMSTTINLGPRPEEEELKKKHAELSELESKLADRELFLTNLRAELSTFERKYVSVVGKRYVELDDIEAKIAERFAKAHPQDQQANDFAKQARSQAESSKASVGESLALRSADSASPEVKFIIATIRSTINDGPLNAESLSYLEKRKLNYQTLDTPFEASALLGAVGLK